MDLSYLGISNCKNIYRNLAPSALVEKALERGEGKLTDTGALLIETGKYTGRSANDKFIVDTATDHDQIAWGKVNRPISEAAFDRCLTKLAAYLQNKDVFVFDGFAGADEACRKKFRIVGETAARALFIHDLLIRPTAEQLEGYGDPDFTIINCPNFHGDPETDELRSEAGILVNFEKHLALIFGTGYCGEIKKTVFTVMNYYLPQEGILPMHSSCNEDPVTKETAVFFGLSGTGKTTLSADPNRVLIGDDEHGWSDSGVFNFEGGCYAKCIDLKEDEQPEIFHAVRYGSLAENLVVDPETRVPDYADDSITANTRVAYPLNYIPNASETECGGIPSVVIFLTCDSFGVLPPISRLDKDAAMYQFVTGFTSKVAGTEIGITEPVPTFSTLFGEPFMPRPASVYAEMLGERIEKYNTKVYLVNTGWVQGPASSTKRIKLSWTRQMVNAALNDAFDKEGVKFEHNEMFNLDIPESIPGSEGIPAEILNPRNAWEDKAAYDEQANLLATKFVENFEAKYTDMPEEIRNGGPKPVK